MADSSPNRDDPAPDDTRARVVAAAARLIAEGGPDAATTRAVAQAAGVQAPTLYRLFGDKQGLLDAVAEAEVAAYMTGKAQHEPHSDPVEDLRRAWDRHVAFGLAHPGPFAIMAGARSRARSAAVEVGLATLRARIRRVALAGRLRMPEERALALVHAAGTGTILTLLSQPEAARDPGLSAAAREAVLAAMTGDAPPGAAGQQGAALVLRASLDDAAALTPGERQLMGELLDRIAEGH